MHLTPAERDRLLLFTAAELARARHRRGLLLNVPEATAFVADVVAEAARDGARLAESVERGRAALRPEEVMRGVADVVRQIEVEAVFDDGTRLAVIPEPFGPPTGTFTSPGAVHVAAIDQDSGEASAAERSGLVEVAVTNESSVPISVTSHFHFFEVNPRLRFDRSAAWGMRLSVPAGVVQRFNPGERVTVELVPIGGRRVAIGFAGLVDGPLDEPGARERGLERARACGYLGADAAAEVADDRSAGPE